MIVAFSVGLLVAVLFLAIVGIIDAVVNSNNDDTGPR